jgi:hypothetical protein
VLAQTFLSPPGPSNTPTLNNGGWVWDMAILLVAIGALIALVVVLGYMRFAPRFQREEGVHPVRAPRIQPGREAPRRPVRITGAPVVVAAPQVPVGVAAAAAPTTPAPQAAPAPAPAAGPPPAQTPAATTAPPTEAPPAAGPAAASGATPAPAVSGESMAQPASAPSVPPTAEHREVTLDQETFDKTLEELLAKGTDRRVAEGQARRAALIAARKKAGG